MNIDRIDAWTENVLDKLDRASKPIAIVCCFIILYFVIRGMIG